MMLKFSLEEDSDGWRLTNTKGLYWNVKHDLSNITEALVGMLRLEARELNRHAQELENAQNK